MSSWVNPFGYMVLLVLAIVLVSAIAVIVGVLQDMLVERRLRRTTVKTILNQADTDKYKNIHIS